MPLASLSAIATVWIIVLENTNWAQVTAANSPFLTSLLPTCAHALNYKNPPQLHPSEPNYIWLEAGSNLGMTTDNDPSSGYALVAGTPHLALQMNVRGVSWKTYQEDISGTDCPLNSSYPYASKHNPYIFFNEVTGNQSATWPECIAHMRPLTELKADLANNNVSRYNFITPNLCNDGHDCPLFDGYTAVDAFVSDYVAAIMASEAFQSGALFITWDEGYASSDGPIGFLAVSPFAKPGYNNSIAYTHSSYVRTIQDIFELSPYLNNAASAVNLADLFDLEQPSTAAPTSPRPTLSKAPVTKAPVTKSPVAKSPSTAKPRKPPTRKPTAHKKTKIKAG